MHISKRIFAFTKPLTQREIPAVFLCHMSKERSFYEHKKPHFNQVPVARRETIRARYVREGSLFKRGSQHDDGNKSCESGCEKITDRKENFISLLTNSKTFDKI